MCQLETRPFNGPPATRRRPPPTQAPDTSPKRPAPVHFRRTERRPATPRQKTPCTSTSTKTQLVTPPANRPRACPTCRQNTGLNLLTAKLGPYIGVPTSPPLRSHGTLVRIYMYALRRAPGPHHGKVLPGELVYQDRTQQVPQGGVDQGLIRDLGDLISRVTADKPAQSSCSSTHSTWTTSREPSGGIA